MKLSPLRKQVESLNKQLQSQNIQIKDLIGFLNKSVPKQIKANAVSQKDYLAKISHKKQKTYQFSKPVVNSNHKTPNKQQHDKERDSLKKQKTPNPKHLQILKPNHLGKEVPMTKSVTFHNIQNALTTRRYLKLSKPQKKMNSSCNLCRDTISLIASYQPIENINQKNILPQTNHTSSHQSSIQSEKKMFKSLQKIEGLSKTKINSKNVKKSVQKETAKTQKKNPLKQIGSNQILSKNQVKSFIEKKSFPLTNPTKNKSKLCLKQQKDPSKKLKSKK